MIYYAPGLSGIGTRDRALALTDEDRKLTPGWCLFYLVTEVYKVPGIAHYDHIGPAGALHWWEAAKARGEVVETDDFEAAPAGVMLMWSGGEYGHAAYSLGDGLMVSTDLPTRGRAGVVPTSAPDVAWEYEPIGYIITDGNGFTYIKPPAE